MQSPLRTHCMFVASRHACAGQSFHSYYPRLTLLKQFKQCFFFKLVFSLQLLVQPHIETFLQLPIEELTNPAIEYMQLKDRGCIHFIQTFRFLHL